MKELLDLFLEYGYTKEEYEIIVNTFPINKYSSEVLYKKVCENFSYLLTLGYENEDIIKMTVILPPLFGYSIKKISKKIDDLVNLGYNMDDIIKMTIG